MRKVFAVSILAFSQILSAQVASKVRKDRELTEHLEVLRRQAEAIAEEGDGTENKKPLPDERG